MEKTKVLYVSQEIFPYNSENQMSNIGSNLPQKTQEDGKDIRIFLPKYGTINERRHQLHEVIRLSGMNLIIDDFDHQLIIKVASIQQLRMQVYFIDNEEYFPRRQQFHDIDGNFMSNNDERLIFYCKGVIETVRKLGWSPDVIHCQGWFSSLVPFYIKKLYSGDPLFENTKVVYSVFDNSKFSGVLSDSLCEKLMFENLEYDDISQLEKPTLLNLHKFAIDYSDAIVQPTLHINNSILNYIESSEKLFLRYPGDEDYEEKYQKLYDKLVEKKEEVLALTE
jgi:starch synthase|tara:strand:- start:529 stop:1368 length:840 start_codon:yes stop_codon:yes gene_type:complete